ncbi:inositol monophosphatase family protein [Nitratifractor sp.]
MGEFYRAAIAACRDADRLLQEGPDPLLLRKDREVGAGGDVSSGLDLALEQILYKHLHTYGRIESEESGVMGEGESTIILDPLDGSSNALSRFPYYGVSVARIAPEGILSEALVCNLANGDLFLLGEEGEPLVSSLYGGEFRPPVPPPAPDIGLFEKAYAHPEIVAALHEEGMKFRSPGALALSLAYARYARFTLFVGPFRIYDFAAGLALCKGLEVIVEEEFVLVSRERETAEKILKMLGEEENRITEEVNN